MGLRGTRLRGEWRKLHNEGLNDLTARQILFGGRMRRAENVERMRGEERCIQGLVGKREEQGG